MRFSAGGEALDLDLKHLVVAGWTGRDPSAIRHHIEELAAIGVSPPSATPLYYRVSAALLTQAGRIQVVGYGSSGEVEPLLLQSGGRRWLGLASDHTDRALEAHSVALSKQVCAKPCAAEVWPWEDVADRLEAIVLESWIDDSGEWVLYQQGTLASIRPLTELAAGAGLDDGQGLGGNHGTSVREKRQGEGCRDYPIDISCFLLYISSPVKRYRAPVGNR